MAIQSMVLDPNAQAYTDDQIVGKVNTAAAQITRAGSVAAAARPLAAGEVGATEMATGAIKTKLTGEADGSKLTTAELAAAAGVTNTQIAAGQANTHMQRRHLTTTGALSGITTAPDASSSNPQDLGPVTGPTGGGAAFSLMNPFLVAYIWKRTA